MSRRGPQISTAGVARQYTGTAGRTENAQVAVYLTYAAPGGHALIDRELYLPQSWISDPGRCRAAGIPPGTGFATKPGLARTMIARALDAGTRPAGWPGMRSTAPTRGYELTGRSDSWATCWPPPRTGTSSPRPGRCAPIR